MKNWAKVGCEALVIIFLAVASGTLLNLPLIRDFYQGKLPPQFIEQKDYPGVIFISLDEAASLLAGQQAFFIDCRSPQAYKEEHIPGAINLPQLLFDDYFREGLIPRDQKVIVYCEGGDCLSSLEVAQKLITIGYTQVCVILEGWAGWQAAGLPVEGNN